MVKTQELFHSPAHQTLKNIVKKRSCLGDMKKLATWGSYLTFVKLGQILHFQVICTAVSYLGNVVVSASDVQLDGWKAIEAWLVSALLHYSALPYIRNFPPHCLSSSRGTPGKWLLATYSWG